MNDVRADLLRAHDFAHERVGFIACRVAQGFTGLVLLAECYHPVSDADYLPDLNVGALLGPDAIRKSLEIALFSPVSVIHVHMHLHSGEPRFSGLDLREYPKFVPDYFKVRRTMPHGAMVLSEDSQYGHIWLSPENIVEIEEYNFLSKTLDIEFLSAQRKRSTKDDLRP